MMAQKHEITRDDILPMERYASERTSLRKALVAKKKNRRVEIGPVCTFYFESYETMLAQVHEMLFIEKGGEEQIADELAAYNPLIPKGRELVATVMFEIDDPVRRAAFLARLGGVEETAFVSVGEHRITGVPEDDLDRTTADGKASSVQFIHFAFDDAAAAAFKATAAKVTLGFDHQQYGHMAMLADEVRAALAEDLD